VKRNDIFLVEVEMKRKEWNEVRKNGMDFEKDRIINIMWE